MNTSTAINAYTKVGIESSVTAADPHRLISMLYQGALLAIANARNSLLRHDIAAKGEAVSKAIMIINDGLNASLDKSVGGELAQNLGALYDYMCSRLLQANAQNDLAAFDEVSALLTDLKGAWDGIRPGSPAPSQHKAAPLPNVQAAVPSAKPNKLQQLYGKA